MMESLSVSTVRKKVMCMRDCVLLKKWLEKKGIQGYN
jgi:hypothetical protein